MTLTRTHRPWGSLFDELRRDLDGLFDHYGAGRPVASSRGVFPPVNLEETSEGFVLTAELPGVAPADIQVSLEGATVMIQGERKPHPATPEEHAVHRRERRTGSFRRAFELPATIDAEKVEAFHRNGVLELRLPKAPEFQPRQINVQAS
ncbi:MAG: Hsp20/alpha crystallin family protein [Myxococcota bacterium]|nr:Hsp20/alpha crystallin family protein [Myxococcota bacterium]